MVPFVDLHGQYKRLEKRIYEAISAVCEASEYILGSSVSKFEKEFAGYLGVNHCVGVANGTDALALAFRALNIGPDDQVIVPAHTFIATAFGVSQAGATPVFADIDPKTYIIDLENAALKVTSKTKAICPVHLYGRSADMDKVSAFAKQYGLEIIEDAAQAHGARWGGRTVGTIGTAGAFSFYPAKNLGCYGDGGAVVTKLPAVAERLHRLRNYGSPVKYQHLEMGYNSRLDSIQAAILSVKLEYLAEWNQKRKEAANRYLELLKQRGLASLVKTSSAPVDSHVYHLFVIEVPERDRVQKQLLEHGVQTVVHYPTPIHLQPAYHHLGHHPGEFPHAEQAASSVLSLPLYPEIEQSQLEEVVDALARCL